jgi:hypothetical protein
MTSHAASYHGLWGAQIRSVTPHPLSCGHPILEAGCSSGIERRSRRNRQRFRRSTRRQAIESQTITGKIVQIFSFGLRR